MPPNPKDRLTALTEEVKKLVPEAEKLDLEVCRLALRREQEKREKASGRFLPFDDEIDPFITALWGINTNWEDLQPWESQTEVHEFLSQYLLPPNQ